VSLFDVNGTLIKLKSYQRNIIVFFCSNMKLVLLLLFVVSVVTQDKSVFDNLFDNGGVATNQKAVATVSTPTDKTILPPDSSTPTIFATTKAFDDLTTKAPKSTNQLQPNSTDQTKNISIVITPCEFYFTKRIIIFLLLKI